MRIKISKDDLLKIIQVVQTITTTKTTLPILSNILLEAKDNKLTLTATDLDVCISTNTQVEVMESGAITLPAKRLCDIVKELPNVDIEISAKKNNIATIECPKTFFKIMGLPKEDFPKTPEFKVKDRITLNQQTLKSMINATSFAVSHDEARYVLNGVLFIVRDNCVRLVATDGRRLALIEKESKLPKAVSKKAIIPTKAILELAKLLKDQDDVGITIDENQALFEMGETFLISRLIEGEFPNYEQVVPKEPKEKIKVDREKFISALRRANIFTSQDSQAVKIEVSKSKLIISKSTPELGEAREELEVEYKGPDILIGFNPGYLMDAMKILETADVGLEITSPEKPGVVRMGSEYVYVVLPMQLS